MQPLNTPCTGVCSTGIGGPVCRGCRRFAHEIIAWNCYTDAERRLVWRRLNQLQHQAAAPWLMVFDSDKLRLAAERLRLRPHFEGTDLGLACALLRAGRHTFSQLADCGVMARRLASDASTLDLWKRIERNLLALSEAHYQRYFAPAQVASEGRADSLACRVAGR